MQTVQKWIEKKYAYLSVLLFLILVAFLAISNRPFLSPTYNLSASDFEYKYEQAISDNLEAEFLQLQKNETKISDAKNTAQLANLYVAKAKRSGNSEYYDQAEVLAKKSLSLKPENKLAVLVQSKIFAARHQFSDAIKTLDLAAGAQSSDPESAYLKSVSFLGLGDYSEALKSINITLNQKPDLASATLKAVILSQIGQDDLAFYYFKKSLAIEDIGEEFQSTITRGQFAQFLTKKGQHQLAHEVCDSGFKINPSSSYLKFIKTQILIQQKKYTLANKYIEEAFASSKDPLHLLSLLVSLKTLNQTENLKVLSAGLINSLSEELKKNEYGHLVDLASVHYLLGEYEISEKILLEDVKNRKSSRANLILAKIYYLQNKFDKAKEKSEEEIFNGTTEAAFYFLMSDVLNQQKNKDLSLTYLNLAKRYNSNFNSEIMYQIP